MTNNKLLDDILNSYLFAQKMKLEDDPRYKKMTFNFIAKTQDPEIEEWHLKFIKKQLFDDGFLKFPEAADDEPYELTAAGIKAAQTGWYKNNTLNTETEKEIKRQTLANLKRSKYSLPISIIAIVISTTISLLSLWNSKQQPNNEEIKELRNRIEKMENSELKTIPNASVTVSDSLSNN